MNSVRESNTIAELVAATESPVHYAAEALWKLAKN